MNVAAFLKSRSSEFLKEHEDGVSVRDLCRKHGVAEARRLKALEDENTRLKRLLADAMLANAALKDAAPEANCLRATSQLGPQSPLAAREYREPEHELFPQTRGLYQPKNRFDGDAAIGASAHLTSRGGAKDTRDQRVRMISWPCRVFRTALPDTTR